MQKVKLFETQLRLCSMDEALERAEAHLGTEKGGYVTTPNATMMEKARRDPSFARILSSSVFSLCDGIGLSLGVRILGGGRVCRVTGVDFGERLLALCAEKGYRVYLFGGEAGIAKAAAHQMQKKYSGLQIVGMEDGYSAGGYETVHRILASGAQVVLVCLGSPKQEQWMYRFHAELGGVLLLGLGGSLDIYAKKKKRAPRPFRVLGLEWLYRIAREPSRIRRTHLFSFVRHVLAEKNSVKTSQKCGFLRTKTR